MKELIEGNVAVQIFRDKKLPSAEQIQNWVRKIKDENRSLFSELEKGERICLDMEFLRQAIECKKKINFLIVSGMREYNFVKPEDYYEDFIDSSGQWTLDQWKFWLPKTIIQEAKIQERFIPLSVIKEWKRCEEAKLFTSYRIRAEDDLCYSESILIGEIRLENGETLYCLIARWGKNLLPVEDVARIHQAFLEKRNENQKKGKIYSRVLFFVLFALSILCSLFVYTKTDRKATLIVFILFLCASCLFSTQLYFEYYKKHPVREKFILAQKQQSS